jgi:hypothetical protein
MMPAIIGVLPRFANQAAARFREAGFEPDEISPMDGEVKFRFLGVPDELLSKLCSAIPPEFYSKKAIVGGNPLEDER